MRALFPAEKPALVLEDGRSGGSKSTTVAPIFWLLGLGSATSSVWVGKASRQVERFIRAQGRQIILSL